MATLKPSKTQTLSTTKCWEWLWKLGGQKCKLKIIDVVLFTEDGTLAQWLFTSKEGLVKRKSSASLKLPNVYKRFIHLGSDDPKNSKSFAAVAYLSDGEQVPITGATLAEILLAGPRIGSLKRGGMIVALRAYVHPKGGHGSGFRNTYKVKDRDFKSYITATQRLLPLDEQVNANKKIVFRDLKSTATKLNQSLDASTYSMVKFLEDEQRTRCWYVEADYVIDHRDTVWVAHFEQVVYSKLKYRNNELGFNEKYGNNKKQKHDNNNNNEDGMKINVDENKDNYNDGNVEGTIPMNGKAQLQRLPTPGAFVCPGDFCDFNGENDDPNQNAGPWTTDKAIEKERQALQETISAYRRTMSQTSALGNAIAKTQDSNEINVVAQRFAIMNKSILHAHEPNAVSYMSNEMKTWRERQAMECKTLYNIDIISPEPGKSLSSAGPINIKWKNKGKIPYVKIQLYCGWAVSNIVTDGLPNEGFAVWRPDVQFRRKESENLKALMDAHVWRFKISCASRPWIYSFSKRFGLRRSLAKIGHRLTGAKNGNSRLQKHELEMQMEEEERVKAKGKRINSNSPSNNNDENNESNIANLNEVSEHYASSTVPGNPVMAGVLANAHPVDYYYREVEVCKNCYNCYTAMDRRREKDNRRQYKDKGGMRTVFAKRIERHKQRLENQEDDGDDLRSAMYDDIGDNMNGFQSSSNYGNKKKKKGPHVSDRLYSLRKKKDMPKNKSNKSKVLSKEQQHQQKSERRERLERRVRQDLNNNPPPSSFGSEYKKFYNSHHPNPSTKFRPPSPIVQSPNKKNENDGYGNFDDDDGGGGGGEYDDDDYLSNQVWIDSGDSDDEEEPLIQSSRDASSSNLINEHQSPPRRNVKHRRQHPLSATTHRSSEKKKEQRQKNYRGYDNDTNSLSPNGRSPLNRAPHRIIANFVNRVVTFVWEHFEGLIPNRGPLKDIDHTFVADVNKQLRIYLKRLQEGCEPDEGTSNVVSMCRIGTKFLMDTSYWQLLQDNRSRCATVVCLAMDLVLLLGLTLEPYVPLLAEKLQQQLNVKATAKWIPKTFSSGIVPSGHELNQPQVLYQDIPEENIDEARERVKKRLMLAEKRRKKRELRKKRAEIDKKKLERGWGAGATKSTSKKSADNINVAKTRRSNAYENKESSDSPVYRPTFPGWGLNPTPTPRSKKREEMKEKRKQQKQKQFEKRQQEGQRQQRTTNSNMHKSASDLINSPNNNNSPPKYIEKQMNATFVDPPNMPRPDVQTYSNNNNVQNSKSEENFDFKSKSSLRQALWMGRSAIAKHSDDSQDIDVGFGRNQHSKIKKSKKAMKMSRSLPALDRPTPNVTPYLKRASLADPKSNNSKKKRKSKGRNSGNNKDDLFEIGPMPRELHRRSGLRQVASLLVIGQLKDLRLIIDVAKTNGLRVLAHSRTEGDQLILGVATVTAGNKKVPETPPKISKLLRDFLIAATAFNEIFRQVDEGKSFLVHGGGELSHGLRDGSRSSRHMQITNKAISSVERLKAWMNVGHSRGEILKGIAAWQTGQAGIAHHHWLKAIDEAVNRDGELAYDVAVARFLIGKHNQSASAYVAEHALEYLSQADSHFARLGEGAEMELEAVRAEIERVRGGRPENPNHPIAKAGNDVTGHLTKKEMASSLNDVGATEQVQFITRPPTAIQETLNWGRKSLDVIKRRLHSEKMLPIYHDPEKDNIGGDRAEQMNARRQALAKSVVIAEGQLAALQAEVKSAMSTGSVDARPNSAMQFTMERKLIKLIDEVGVRAAEYSKIVDRDKKYVEKQVELNLTSQFHKANNQKSQLELQKKQARQRVETMEQQHIESRRPMEEDNFAGRNKVPKFWAKKMLQQQLQQEGESVEAGINQTGQERMRNQYTSNAVKVPDKVAVTKEVDPQQQQIVNKEFDETQTAVPYSKTISKDPVVNAIAKAAHQSHIQDDSHSSMGGEDLMAVLKSQIHESCSSNNLGKFVQVLATGIMKVNSIIDDEQNTAIHVASRKGSMEIVEYCCSHGGEELIDSQNMEGNTALHYAYERKDMKMADLLMAHGANSHLKNMYGLKAQGGAHPRSFRDFAAFAV